MFGNYHKFIAILDKRERHLAFFILLLMIIVAVIEVLGVASIMPFMAVLSKPAMVEKNSILFFVYNALSFHSTDTFLFFLGSCVLVFLVGSTFLKALVVWAQVYYANLRNYSISSRLITGYICQPYQWFLTRNSSTFASTILEEVSRVVNGSLYPYMRLISNGLVTIFIFALLIFIDPVLAISVALILGVSYGAIFKFASKRLGAIGVTASVTQRKRIHVVQEAFGGIKEVKIFGIEKSFIEKYRIPARKLALINVSVKLWEEMPSFGMQALVFGGMMVTILYLMETRNGLADIIPILALYALGAYKLMPALQEVYRQLSVIRYNQSALDTIYHDINLLNSSESLHEDKNNSLAIRNYLEIRELQFSYPGTNKRALDNVTLKIKKNNTVGFVGSSGSGKTTSVDIILGLLDPLHGGVFIDNEEINKDNLRSWQRGLGYVPQQIFLSDDTVAANIAFGIPSHKIDYVAVEKAALTANLHQFIVDELPEGYNTPVGERGVRLSGGQRQRIGIARALYYDPDTLIFDEATSALDNITERIVMDAVRKIGHKKTIIIVAHRLSTVQSCDNIFLFEKGKVVANGSYDELIKTNSKFKELALVTK